MKMNRKASLALLALLLCFVMVMPMLAACGGGLELPTEEEEVGLTVEENLTAAQVQTSVAETVTAEETETEEYDPMRDYIPPENYIDYSDNENLNSTQNVGGKGSMVVAGGDNVQSWFSYYEYVKNNDKLIYSAAGRRDAAEKAMREMLTVRWTPSEDTTYSYNPAAYQDGATVVESEFAVNQITLEKGKVYQGLPYTLGSAGLASFVTGFTAQNGVYTIPLNQRILSGSSQISARLGVDDADALYWGWAAVSPSVRFTDTASMVKAKGVLPVGDYTLPAESLAGLSDDVVAEAGADKMYAAYAKLQKADGLVADTESLQHAMMVVSVSLVKDSAGNLDPNASVVTVLEQTDANLVAYNALSADEKAAKKNEALVIGGIDVKYTFAELFGAGYLPITCKELNVDGALDNVYIGDSIRAAANYTKSTLFSGVLTSNRRIVLLNQVVTDLEGKVMIDTTAYPTEASVTDDLFQYNLTPWDDASEVGRRRGDCATSGVLVSKENYRCVLTGVLSTGEIVTFRDYEFTF